jgi:hypothetical protein
MPRSVQTSPRGNQKTARPTKQSEKSKEPIVKMAHAPAITKENDQIVIKPMKEQKLYLSKYSIHFQLTMLFVQRNSLN